MAGYESVLTSEFGRYVVWYYARQDLRAEAEAAFRQALSLDGGVPDGPVYTPSDKAYWRIDLSPYVSSISISDSFSQAAKSVDLVLSCAEGGEELRSLVQCGGIIRVFADTYRGTVSVPMTDPANPLVQNELFRGYVFSRDSSSAPIGDVLQLKAYDPMIYLTLNEYDLVKKKKTASQIIREIVVKAGLVPGSPFQDTGVKLSKLTTRGLSLYDGCVLALQKNQKLTGKRYRLQAKQGKVVLFKRVAPADTWTFDSRVNIVDASHSVSIEDLTTRATIRAQAEKKVVTREAKVAAEVENKYGKVHKIVDIGDYSASEMQKARRAVVRDEGKPAEEISITVPIITSIEAGDGVYVYDDDLKFKQLFWVEEVTHSITPVGGTTQMTLVRKEADIKYPEIDDPTKANAAKTKLQTEKTEYNLKVAVVNFEGSKYKGTEAICTIRKTHPLAKKPYVKLYGGTAGTKQVQVVGTHRASEGGADIRLAATVAEDLRPKLTTGSRVKVKGMKSI